MNAVMMSTWISEMSTKYHADSTLDLIWKMFNAPAILVQIFFRTSVRSTLKSGFPYLFTASAMEIPPSGARSVIFSSFHVPSPIFSP